MKRTVLFWTCLQGPVGICILMMFAWGEPQESIKMAIIAELATFVFAFMMNGAIDIIEWASKNEEEITNN